MTLWTRVKLLLLLGSSLPGVSLAAPEEVQKVLTPNNHIADPAILEALKTHADPVEAFVALRPEAAAELAQPRLLHIAGEPEPEWLTEGDKMRLRRKGKKFRDVTDFHEFYTQVTESTTPYKARLPALVHQRFVKPLFNKVSTKRMHDALEKLTSFYTRYFDSTDGEASSQWLYDQVAEIIREAPFHTHVSLEVFTHSFRQSSIIARFEPKAKNFSTPLTILGAHQDSANYLFPLLPAPGADDDGSGSITILEAFRVLAQSGYVPKEGPVEFHWFAAEEGGNLGSQAVARYKKESGARIGAMMEFDMTAFVARNSTESIAFIKPHSDEALLDWSVALAQEYVSIPAQIRQLPSFADSDYSSFSKLGYPAAFATEGDPMAHGKFPGDYNPYIHGVGDTMNVDDEHGSFSLEHMARFAELAIAFVVEQAGWDNKWR